MVATKFQKKLGVVDIKDEECTFNVGGKSKGVRE